MYFLYAGAPLSLTQINALEETGSTLSAAYTLSATQGAELIVVFVPTKFRVYNGICEFEADSESLYWVVNDLPERLRTVVANISNDIGYIDLTPKLVESAKQGGMLYFLDDSHWSPEGHNVAAKAISEYLSKQKSQGNWGTRNNHSQ